MKPSPKLTDAQLLAQLASDWGYGPSPDDALSMIEDYIHDRLWL